MACTKGAEAEWLPEFLCCFWRWLQVGSKKRDGKRDVLLPLPGSVARGQKQDVSLLPNAACSPDRGCRSSLSLQPPCCQEAVRSEEVEIKALKEAKVNF